MRHELIGAFHFAFVILHSSFRYCASMLSTTTWADPRRASWPSRSGQLVTGSQSPLGRRKPTTRLYWLGVSGSSIRCASMATSVGQLDDGGKILTNRLDHPPAHRQLDRIARVQVVGLEVAAFVGLEECP